MIGNRFLPLDGEENDLDDQCDHCNKDIIDLFLIDHEGGHHGITEPLILIVTWN